MTDFIPVIGSSAIKEVAYDPVTSTLKVRFTSGMEYHYPSVDHAHFLALIRQDSRATSAGKYFNAHIVGKFGARLVSKGASS